MSSELSATMLRLKKMSAITAKNYNFVMGRSRLFFDGTNLGAVDPGELHILDTICS